jgi:imidazole glycerol-phosphate synthase subunit HisH
VIGIVDYGMGNLFSVSKALERLNVPYFISDNKEQLLEADGLLLPGVGAFRDAMALLKETSLDETIKKFVQKGKPLLGICLGMQLLFETSEENGKFEGLGLLSGEAVRIPSRDSEGKEYKVPHMGWNFVSFQTPASITADVEEDYVYFVHSYYIKDVPDENLIGSAEYGGVEIPAIVGNGNVWGMQFHPEKSGELGMKLLKNFTDLVQKSEVVR